MSKLKSISFGSKIISRGNRNIVYNWGNLGHPHSCNENNFF